MCLFSVVHHKVRECVLNMRGVGGGIFIHNFLKVGGKCYTHSVLNIPGIFNLKIKCY